MKLLFRRNFLKLAGALMAMPALPQLASALDYPTRPTKIVAGFAAGGGVDITARLIGQWLADHLGQPFVVENRTGAGGNIGTEAVVNAAPDGYTLLLATVPNAVNASLYEKLNFNFVRDIAPVAGVIRVPMVVLVHPSVPAQTLAEFIAYAKANPGKLNYGSAGASTTHHLAGELFKILTKTNIQHVPYRGAGPAMQDLIAGHVPVVFDGLGSSAAPVRAGQLRALAVAAPKRVPAFPDLPTAAEAGLAGYEVSTWYGLFAPRNTPPAIVDQMIKELQKAMQTPAIKEAWERNGSDVPDVTGPAFAKMVSAEVERWRKVVTEANVKLD